MDHVAVLHGRHQRPEELEVTVLVEVVRLAQIFESFALGLVGLVSGVQNSLKTDHDIYSN